MSNKVLYHEDSDSDSDEYVEEIDYINEWEDKYESKPYLHQQKCVYVSLILIANAYMKVGEDVDKDEPTELIGCLKFGYTEVPKSSVYKRMRAQFGEYDAIWAVPLLVANCINPSELESVVKDALKDHQVKIACSASCHYKIPKEFYEVSQNVLDIVQTIAFKHGCKKVHRIEYDLDDDSALDRIVPEEFYPSFVEKSDSLSASDIQTIKQTW
jgi:hypothetical protein